MTTEDRDILISRIVDAEATDTDWAAFRAMAKGDETAWRDLAEAQHDAADLVTAIGSAIAIADEIDAPLDDHLNFRFQQRMAKVAVWGGWLTAAAVALAWVTEAPVSKDRGNLDGVNAAGLIPLGPRLDESSADDAYAHYLNRGKETGIVVEESPAPVLLRMEPLAGDSGYEVLFLRQTIERRTVKDLYRFGQDEFGQPHPVPFQRSQSSSGPV